MVAPLQPLPDSVRTLRNTLQSAHASSYATNCQAASTGSAAPTVIPHGPNMPALALLPTPAPSERVSPSINSSPILAAQDLMLARDLDFDLGFSRSPSPLSDLETDMSELSGMFLFIVHAETRLDLRRAFAYRQGIDDRGCQLQ